MHDRRQATYIYTPRYAVDLGRHVFPTRKYVRIADRLRAEDGVGPSSFVEPDPASDDEICSAHTRRYAEACRRGTLTPLEIARLELPWSEALYDAAARCVRGSILAGELALARGVGLHIGGGFHHAFPDHGEGFCVFNDIACAVRALQRRGSIERACVIDCDLHQGNGTAAIFADDADVGTFSIHEEGIYPFPKPPSDIDVGLPARTADTEYLQALRDGLQRFASGRAADLAFYVAGADPYVHDQLGTLRVSKDGLRARDRQVVELCADRGWPLVVVLAGGYAIDPEDTADIQLASLRCARELWR